MVTNYTPLRTRPVNPAWTAAAHGQFGFVSMSTRYVRVHLEDDAWTTVPVTPTTTAGVVFQMICKKRNLAKGHAEYQLYVSDSNSDHAFERLLDPSELPWEIQETVRKHGQLENFKFVFKLVSKDSIDNIAGAQASAKRHSSGSDDGAAQSRPRSSSVKDSARCGYLEKKGARNKSWRERWFVLQGDKLFYFKTHEHTSSISNIPLADSRVRESHNRRPQEYVFEIDTKSRIFFLRARSYSLMMEWIKCLQRSTSMEEENIMDDIQIWMEEVTFSPSFDIPLPTVHNPERASDIPFSRGRSRSSRPTATSAS